MTTEWVLGLLVVTVLALVVLVGQALGRLDRQGWELLKLQDQVALLQHGQLVRDAVARPWAHHNEEQHDAWDPEPRAPA